MCHEFHVNLRKMNLSHKDTPIVFINVMLFRHCFVFVCRVSLFLASLCEVFISLIFLLQSQFTFFLSFSSHICLKYFYIARMIEQLPNFAKYHIIFHPFTFFSFCNPCFFPSNFTFLFFSSTFTLTLQFPPF